MNGRNGMTGSRKRSLPILGAKIDALNWGEVLSTLQLWAEENKSRYVCICNVHSVVTAYDNNEFCRIINQADMATPDGMPIAWAMRLQGFSRQERINGPELMWRYCKQAAENGQSVFFYGSTEQTLVLLKQSFQSTLSNLKIAGMLSPPFRKLTKEEDSIEVEQINTSGASVVFVGLGCPKQEIWMAGHMGRVNAVMIGVGAAFDFQAGVITRAPQWVQDIGLEWLYRLIIEPRRLWRRYLVSNLSFILRAVPSLLISGIHRPHK